MLHIPYGKITSGKKCARENQAKGHNYSSHYLANRASFIFINKKNKIYTAQTILNISFRVVFFTLCKRLSKKIA